MRKMRSQGVILGTCGESTIRLRPMLVFQEKHGEFGYPKKHFCAACEGVADII